MTALCWSSREEIPHIQGKRNPSKTVGIARGHQRANTLKPYSQKTSQSNHTRTTALSKSMKLSHARGATQDGLVMVEKSDRMLWPGKKVPLSSTEFLQILCQGPGSFREPKPPELLLQEVQTFPDYSWPGQHPDRSPGRPRAVGPRALSCDPGESKCSPRRMRPGPPSSWPC